MADEILELWGRYSLSLKRLGHSLALSSLVVLSSPVDVFGQDSVAIVQGFINAAYPDLKEQRLHATIIRSTPFNAEWSRVQQTYVQIHHGVPILNSAERESKEWLGISVTIGDLGRPTDVRVNGQYVRSTEQRALVATVGARPNWTTSDVDRELIRRGASFPSTQKAAFAAHLNLSALEPFIGAVIEQEISFQVLEIGQGPERALLAVEWCVDVMTRGLGAERKFYSLCFEPFEGKLVRLRNEGLTQ